jgi:hypothetical protein
MGGGGGEKGGSGTQFPVTCLSMGGYRVLPWSDLMIRVGRPWNLLLLLMGPGPSSLLHSTNTIVIRRRHKGHEYNVKQHDNNVTRHDYTVKWHVCNVKQHDYTIKRHY